MHVDAGGGLLLRGLGLGQCFIRQDQVVLPVGDLCLDAFDAVFGAVILVHQIGNQCRGILLIEDREAGLVAESLMLLADDVQTEVVESRDGQAAGVRSLDQLADPLLHLACGLVGEGHGDDVLRADTALLDQIGDLACDHTGLAATGPCQYQQRPADIFDGFLLAGVEA